MAGTLLFRGMLVGIVAGLLTFGFAKLFGEALVDRAIAFETQMDAANVDQRAAAQEMGMAKSEPELVSRDVQAGLGLFAGVMVYATAFGGLFALVFAFAFGRVRGVSPRALSAMLAGAGFVAVYLVPNLKYPANPPSVGASETIGYRTALFFIMVAISMIGMVGALSLRQKLAGRHGGWNATLAAGALYLAIVVAAQLALPAVNEVPDQFPATLLWQFRMASLGMQAVMWATLGLLFGAVCESVLTGRRGMGHARVR